VIINYLINLVLYFFFYSIFFISTIGLGCFVKNFFGQRSKENFFELAIYGLLFNLVLGFFIYYFFTNSLFFNIFFLTLGCVFYLYFYHSIENISFKKTIFFLLLLFSGLLISKTHEDFPTYHFFSVQQIFENKLTIGLSLINFRFTHASLLSYVQALYVLPFFNYKFIHIPVFFIYISTIGYFLFQYNQSKSKLESFFCFFVIALTLVKFSRLSEHGYDFPAQFLLFIVFHKLYFFAKKLKEIRKSIIIYLFAVLIKPISLLFAPLFFYLFFKLKKKAFFLITKCKLFLFVLSLLTFILISSSFVRTGCVFYPINQTCFSKEKIFWSQKQELENYSKVVTNWAKGFYHQKVSKYTEINDNDIYLKSFNWLKYWIDIHFFYKIFEFLLICLFIFLLIYLTTKKIKDEKKFNIKDHYLLIFLSLSSVFFWLITVPQFRFGFSSIVIFCFFGFLLFLKKELHFKNKQALIFFFFLFAIFNIKNFIRIHSEINRIDEYKFINFPWYVNKNIKYDQSKFTVQEGDFIRIIKKNLK